MTPPAAPDVLTTPYSRKSQKGGTLIAEEVLSVEEQLRHLADPDLDRPGRCDNCGCDRLHVHDRRSRKVEDAPYGELDFWRFRCKACRAVWMVLAAFVARHLHQRWEAVQGAAEGAGVVAETGTPKSVKASPQTIRRWIGRLCSSAVVLVQALADAGVSVVAVTRAELVDGLASAGLVPGRRKLTAVAAWVDRLVPGLRVV